MQKSGWPFSKSRLDNLDNRLDGFDCHLHRLDKDLDNRLDDLGGRLDGLNSHSDNLDNRLDWDLDRTTGCCP